MWSTLNHLYIPLLIILVPLTIRAELNIEPIQVGSEWGRVAIPPHNLKPFPEFLSPFLKIAESTGRLRGGTAFLLSGTGNRHIVATNAHVLIQDLDNLKNSLASLSKDPKAACQSWIKQGQAEEINFTLLGVKARCAQLIGIWLEIDFALLEVEFPEGAKINELGIPLLPNDISAGESLVLFGHGGFKNPGSIDQPYLLSSHDTDCRTFAGSGQEKLLADQDMKKPGSYKSWSIPIGCDISWGDSGSPVIKASDGSLVGIAWTGRFPKNEKLVNSEALKALSSNSPEIWSELNYMVPVTKILEVLSSSHVNLDQ